MAPDSKSVMPVFGSTIAGRCGLDSRTYERSAVGRSCLLLTWYPAIGIDGREWFSLQIFELDPLGLVGKAELFQDNEYLGRVGNLVCILGQSQLQYAGRLLASTPPVKCDRLHCQLRL